MSRVLWIPVEVVVLSTMLALVRVHLHQVGQFSAVILDGSLIRRDVRYSQDSRCKRYRYNRWRCRYNRWHCRRLSYILLLYKDLEYWRTWRLVLSHFKPVRDSAGVEGSS